MNIKKILLTNKPHILTLLGTLVLVAASLIFFNGICRLLFLLISGSLVGYYYGFNDWRIFARPYTDEFYEKLNSLTDQTMTTEYGPNGKISKKIIVKKKVPPTPFNRSDLNESALVNCLWVHFVCGLTAAIALFFLSNHINIYHLSRSIRYFGLSDLFLFLLTILGFSGLLPRTIWFFASRGEFNLK